MELATDLIAIVGFFMLGLVTPTLFKINNKISYTYLAISFGLIAASLVLG